MVKSYHWHLDVTFREDANHTIEKDSAYNLNIMKKMAINTLKLVDVGSGVKQPVIARMENGTSSPQLDTVLKVLAPLGKTLYIGDL